MAKTVAFVLFLATVIIASLVGNSIGSPVPKLVNPITLQDQHCQLWVQQLYPVTQASLITTVPTTNSAPKTTTAPVNYLARCSCLESCLSKHLNPLLHGIQNGDFDHHKEMYQCSQECYSPDFNLYVNLESPTESPSNVLEAHNKLIQNSDSVYEMTQKEFISTLLQKMTGGPYGRMIQDIQDKYNVNPKYRARVKMAPIPSDQEAVLAATDPVGTTHITDPFYIGATKPTEELSYSCFANLMTRKYTRVGQLERNLEEVYYCRQYTPCLDTLLTEFLNALDPETSKPETLKH